MIMTEAQFLAKLEQEQAVIRNTHVVFTSGDHGDLYVNKDVIYTNPRSIGLICNHMVAKFRAEDGDAHVVIGPTIGGVILSTRIAGILARDTRGEVRSVYAEKSVDGKSFEIRRGFDELIRGRRTLVTEDVLNTGRTGAKVIQAVRDVGGIVAGLVAICNRGEATKESMGLKDGELFICMSTLPKQNKWKALVCPLCAQGIPVNVNVGHGRAFLAAKVAAATQG